MKTPLAVIRGFAENLEENTNEEKKKYYLEQTKKIAGEQGDCKELKELYRRVLEEYHAGSVSPEVCGKIYAICMDCAYPR